MTVVSPADLVARVREARERPDRAVLEGFHAVKHALRFGGRIDLLATSDPEALAALAAALAPDVAGVLRAHAQVVPRDVLAALAPRPPATRVVAVARRPPAHPAAVLASGSGPVVLLEDPRHLGNVGATVRVAAAAGADAVLTTGPRDPWDPTALRGSAGLHFALPVARVETLALGDRPLVALDPGGEPLPGGLPQRSVLAFGTERHGLSEALQARAAHRVAIPMRPGVSSLNLATAVAVALYATGLAQL